MRAIVILSLSWLATPVGATPPSIAHYGPAAVDADAHFERADKHYGDGDYRAAIAQLDAAIELDPQPGFYALRAQSYKQLGLGNEPHPRGDSERARLFRSAAADLDAQLSFPALMDAERAGIVAHRDELLASAAQLEERAPPPEAPTIPSEPAPPRAGWALIGVGATSAVVGSVLSAFSFRGVRTCDASNVTCTASLEPRAGFLAPGVILGATGGALAAVGTLLVLRRHHERPNGGQRTRVAGRGLLGAGAAVLAGGAIAGIVAGVAWSRVDERDPDPAQLKAAERATNASLSLLTLAAAPIAAGITALVAARHSDKAALRLVPVLARERVGAGISVAF